MATFLHERLILYPRPAPKMGIFANVKKFHIYRGRVQFLKFVVLAKKMKVKEEKIKIVKTWQEEQSVRHLGIIKLCQLLPIIHQGLQQDRGFSYFYSEDING